MKQLVIGVSTNNPEDVSRFENYFTHCMSKPEDQGGDTLDLIAISYDFNSNYNHAMSQNNNLNPSAIYFDDTTNFPNTQNTDNLLTTYKIFFYLIIYDRLTQDKISEPSSHLRLIFKLLKKNGSLLINVEFFYNRFPDFFPNYWEFAKDITVPELRKTLEEFGATENDWMIKIQQIENKNDLLLSIKNKAADKVRERVISILSELSENPDEVPDVTIGTHFLTTDQLYNSPDMEKPSTEYEDYFNPCIIIRKKKNSP